MTILERLRADLTPALRQNRSVEASTIRSLIAAIENAGAIEAESSANPKVGLGHDQPRRDLSCEDIAMILERERTEVSEALSRYRELGLSEEAKVLEIRLRVIERYRAS